LTASHVGKVRFMIILAPPHPPPSKIFLSLSLSLSLSLPVRSVAAERGRAVAEYAGLVAKHTGHATEYTSVVGSDTSGGTGPGCSSSSSSSSNCGAFRIRRRDQAAAHEKKEKNDSQRTRRVSRKDSEVKHSAFFCSRAYLSL
jgi:hypothetical protein